MYKIKDNIKNHNIENMKNGYLLDYNIYEMSMHEKLYHTLLGAIVIYIFAYIFYRSHVISIFLTPMALIYPKLRKKELLTKRKKKLNLQFKDMLYSLSSSLCAGKSMENSFKDVLRDLFVLYPNKDDYIIVEVEHIVRKLEMNETIESILDDFASRAHIEDIDNFVDVFQTCKRAGGNMVEVMRNTSCIINDRIEIEQDIEMMLAERRFEQKILNIMPVLMVILLSTTAWEYMKPVYTTAAGRLVMTISICILIAAYFISVKIMDIRL